MANRIHDYDSRFRNALKKLQSLDIPETNKKLILEFADVSLSEGLSKARVTKYMQYLTSMSRWIGTDFPEADRAAIRKVCRDIELSPYQDFTKSEHKIILRKFYKWLRGTEDYPDEVRWIRPRSKMTGKIKMPEELLSEEEVKEMIRLTPSDRNRAFIACLYETGCRIGEMLPIRIKHISYDEYGGLISVDGKTGPRKVRIISSLPFLEMWLNKHPDSGDREASVWVKTNREMVKYGQVLCILKDSARRAGIKKRVYPHLFRHSRATFLARHLTEAQMKVYLGWVQASDMAGVYVHMSQRDLDDTMLRVAGIQRPEAEKPKENLRPRICDRCKKANPYTYSFCVRCGFPLNESEHMKILRNEEDRQAADSILDELIKDDEFRELLIKKLKGL